MPSETVRKLELAAKTLLSSAHYENAKTILFVYFVLTNGIKAQRHLRARGIIGTAQEFWRWLVEVSIGILDTLASIDIISQRVILLALRLPAAKRKVQAEMDKARLDIETKLIPKGAEVSRHINLPLTGQSPEWILEEMEKMDNELGVQTNWRLGKLSGAVYRTCLSAAVNSY